MASKDGRRGLADQIAILQVDEVLKRDAGKSYQAEITLFVVSPEARGMGVGRKLFNHMLGVFRNAGMNEYFLFTDTTCDYGFYDYRGLTRKAERTVRRDSFTQGGLEDGALSFFLYEGRCCTFLPCMESDIFGKASVYGQHSLIWVVDLSAIVDGTTSEESMPSPF